MGIKITVITLFIRSKDYLVSCWKKYEILEKRLSELEKDVQGGLLDRCPRCGKRAFGTVSTKEIITNSQNQTLPQPFGTKRELKCGECSYMETKNEKI